MALSPKLRIFPHTGAIVRNSQKKHSETTLFSEVYCPGMSGRYFCIKKAMKRETRIALCALNNIFGYHPSLAFELMEKAGSAEALFNGPLPECGHPELADRLNETSLTWAEKELERVHRQGFKFIPYGDEDYPPALADIDDPPLGIYLNGSSAPAEIFSLRPMVAVVGTRDISPYGTLWCRRLVQTLAEAAVQPCIVSGLAYGADGIAHRTALECGLTTIGVMATGIDKIYPWQHTELASQIVGTPGCGLVTDYPTGTAPVALNFVRRNRIIAALASATVVIESKKKGGSLMTAKYAVDYNRDVFAVPGRLDDVRSRGCNSLISSHMAEIVTSPEELVEALGLKPRSANSKDRRSAFYTRLSRKYGTASVQVAVGMAVFDSPGIGYEELAAAAKVPYVNVLETVGMLEVDGLVTTDLLQRCTVNDR